MGLVETIKDGDWRSVRSAIAKLSSIKLGPTSEPTFAGIKFTGLTASRLVASDANKALVSSALIDWVTGTANRVTVSADDDPAGGIVLTGPQDIDTTASPTFTKVLVGDGTVSAPGFAFADDTDTGIYVHEDGGGHQRIAFSCDGVKVFEITDYDGIELKDMDSVYYAEVRFTGTAMTVNRQFSIDLNNAARTLDLTGNPTLADWFDQSVKIVSSPTFVGLTLTNAAVIGSNSVVFQPGIDSTTFFQVLDVNGGTPIFNVDTTNERVGIGTTAPNAPLEVKGAKPGVVGGHQSGQLQVTGTGGEFYCAVITGHNSFNGNTQLWYLGNTSSSSHNDIAFINRQNAPIHFYTSNASRVTIDAAGNVGIGETAPQDKLEVNGTVLVKDALKFTQDDGLEFIDSLADGYMDYGATTAHRFNSPIEASQIGVAADANLLQLTANLLTANGAVTATGTVQAEHLYSTDDAQIDAYLQVDGSISIGDYAFEPTGGTSGHVLNLVDTNPSIRLDIQRDSVSGLAFNFFDLNAKSLDEGTGTGLSDQLGVVGLYGDFNAGVDNKPYGKYIYMGAGNDTAYNAAFVKIDAGDKLALGLSSNTRPTTAMLEVYGTALIADKLAFTQTDLNEYIDSLADGYMDYGATTAHRFNNDVIVTGAIASGTATITASADDTDVSGINTLFINPAGAVVIGGFVGGVAGQILFVSAIANGQDITLEHAEGIGGATQDVYLHSGLDETLSTEFGGWTLTCDGTNWYDTSHAKHV